MTTTFAVVGAVAVMLFAISAFLEASVHAWDRIKWLHEDHVARVVGNRIKTEAYWFSESMEAMLALEAIGKALSDNGSFRISESRDEWRRAMKAALRQGIEGKPKEKI